MCSVNIDELNEDKRAFMRVWTQYVK